MRDSDLAAHLVDIKYLLAALLLASVAAEAAATGYDANAAAVVIAAGLATAPVGLAYVVNTLSVQGAADSSGTDDDR